MPLLCTILAISSLAAGQGADIEFHRVFTKGEKATYKVHSQLTAEVREGELETWIPQDLDLVYNFNYEVTEMKADGICVLKYARPTMTEIQGETADQPPVRKVEKVNLNYFLTVSPVNEILEVKEVPKPGAKPPASPKSGGGLRLMSSLGAEMQLQDFLGQFTGEIYRLALFAGSLDSGLDFAPPLPVYGVKPGDQWKKTVSYQPQKMQGSGKVAVQRLDYTYTYKGVADYNGKKYQRIEGVVSVKTDLAEYIHQLFQVKSDRTGLKEIPLQFKATVVFDLDMKTHQTVRAIARSEGGFAIVAQGVSKPVHEERFNASSTLSLLSVTR